VQLVKGRSDEAAESLDFHSVTPLRLRLRPAKPRVARIYRGFQ